MKGVILLGCEGRQDQGFIFCRGSENIILNLGKCVYSSNYLELLEYIEKIAKLKNGPCCVHHQIMNTLYKFYQLDFLSEKQYEYINRYTDMHKICGLILKIGEDKNDVDENL